MRVTSSPSITSSCLDYYARCAAKALLIALALFTIANVARAETWGEKLGFPAGKKVLILHADDIGMCYEANEAAKNYLKAGQIQSAALMVPCPWYNEMANWYIENPDYDLGLHLALTSEWKWYRWGPVAERSKVPGLIDNEGYLWRSVQSVVLAAKPTEIEEEIRAQINRAIARGTKPSHIDTHMGTLYARPDYTRAYLKVAEEFRIPAMVVEPTPKVMEKFKKQGYPVSEAGSQLLRDYKLPKLDDFWAAPEGKTYEEKREKFFELVRSFDPGITEIIFHPSVQTEGLKAITGSWQQRVWEAQMFADPAVHAFFEREGILFTNWKEMMRRFDKKEPAAKAGG
ncbi:MAG TPA: polysaccharide deacetylase family protein [Pirellulales bacterium]|nr:polysaccharide deacetylase family protein [Pirellulales bacterium]